jgi:hypothetical protein
MEGAAIPSPFPHLTCHRRLRSFPGLAPCVPRFLRRPGPFGVSQVLPPLRVLVWL